MDSEKILEINQAPFLRELHNTAFSFAVLETTEIPKAWILEKFLVLKFSDVLTYNVPFFLNWNCFSRKAIIYFPKMKISHEIIRYLNKNYYIYIELNEFYIPLRKNYKTKDYYHDLLIYGVNMDNSKFLTIAYNCTGAFSPQWVSFNDIDEAYSNYKMKYLLKAIPFCISEKYDFFKENSSAIIHNLNFMLNTKKECFGMNSYKYVLKHIENVKSNNIKIDLRNFRTIYEYQKVLLLFNKVFDINENFYNILLNLEEQANVIFNLAIKYELTSNQDILCKIEAKLIYLIEKNEKILRDIYDYLTKSNYKFKH